jgi:Fe-S-cluster containining protein
MERDEILRAYRELRDEVDRQIDLYLNNSPLPMNCGEGCASCCIDFAVLPLEALIISEALRSLPSSKFLGDSGGEGCPLLSDDRCIIYDERPIICRTQGLPLGYLDHETGTATLSICERNDPELREWRPEELFMMDEINGRLMTLNRALAVSFTLNPAVRYPIREVLEDFLSGVTRFPV